MRKLFVVATFVALSACSNPVNGPTTPANGGIYVPTQCVPVPDLVDC